MSNLEEQKICGNCGHKKLFHMNFNDECDVCDDPTIPLEKKCIGYSEKKEMKNVR